MLSAEAEKAIFADIRAEWDKAEEDIKLAEQVCNKIIEPSIKELRYSGRRLIDALNEAANTGDQEKIRAYLEDARFNCFRARHDAVDAVVGKIAVSLEIMVTKLGYEAILRACPDFGDYWTTLKDTQQKISDSRKDRDNRNKIYASIEDLDLEALVRGFSKMQACEPIMKGLAIQNKWSRRITIALLVLTMIACVLQAVGVIPPFLATSPTP